MNTINRYDSTLAELKEFAAKRVLLSQIEDLMTNLDDGVIFKAGTEDYNIALDTHSLETAVVWLNDHLEQLWENADYELEAELNVK